MPLVNRFRTIKPHLLNTYFTVILKFISNLPYSWVIACLYGFSFIIQTRTTSQTRCHHVLVGRLGKWLVVRWFCGWSYAWKYQNNYCNYVITLIIIGTIFFTSTTLLCGLRIPSSCNWICDVYCHIRWFKNTEPSYDLHQYKIINCIPDTISFLSESQLATVWIKSATFVMTINSKYSITCTLNVATFFMASHAPSVTHSATCFKRTGSNFRGLHGSLFVAYL